MLTFGGSSSQPQILKHLTSACVGRDLGLSRVLAPGLINVINQSLYFASEY